MNSEELKTEISLRIKKMREALKCSQEKMAAHLGIKRASYTKYECRRAIPTVTSLNVLAAYFDVSLDWLVANKGPMFYKGKMRAEDTGEFMGEVKELFDLMSRIPLLRHEVLSCFHKFKLDYKDLVESQK
jgi:transcriptional regulator with XRE-family HTH domain